MEIAKKIQKNVGRAKKKKRSTGFKIITNTNYYEVFKPDDVTFGDISHIVDTKFEKMYILNSGGEI